MSVVTSSDVAAGTIVAKNFLPAARVLARSFREHHPDVPFFVVLADEVQSCFEPDREPVTLLSLDALGLPDRRRLCFRYTRHPITASAKPWLLTHLLDLGFSGALYLDADMLVTGDLTPLFDAARRHSLVLTPHLLRPPRGPDRVARELAVLRAGAFNGGCLGTSGSSEARRFLSWMQQRMLFHCRRSLAEGLHHDQRWLDLAPAMLDDVCIVRDPGCNVAYWNLAERAIELGPSGMTVGGAPCRFVHFSGFDPARPHALSRHAPPTAEPATGPVAALFERYARRLESAGLAEAERWPYAYGAFDNGVPIPDVAREIYLELGTDVDRFGDPFQAAAPTSFFRWLLQPADAGPRAGGINRLWDAVYRRRPDVQRAFPDARRRGRRAFLQWARRTGAAEHGIPGAFLDTSGGLIAAAR